MVPGFDAVSHHDLNSHRVREDSTDWQLLLTCEHAGNGVPPAYEALFRGAFEVLDSHRGWDPGALTLAQTFEQRFNAPLFYHTSSRLLVETNRSVGRRGLFSEFTGGLSKEEKASILREFYAPHRTLVEAWIKQHFDAGRGVIHLSFHTFTPNLNGQVRNADVGLLYDPQRNGEKSLCRSWQSALKRRRADLRIRRNYPYLGSADGFTTHLRRRFAAQYAGIELEVNQLWPLTKPADWPELGRDLAESFADAWRQQ